ncbi:ABC transporter ATP-binding protein [Luteimonas sp. R10]|uniref:ABC transporter ATP-binding protein n=1 Tax=Luteimonas sp. R10 TaxID=3108176 RepID=UPI0030921B3E|nr:ABC transporter ATP-binding protein [Luteimonas sp. R10]
MQSLSKHYAGRAVVHGVSFTVTGGDLVVLLGPSGSGKSTILRIIAGLTAADAGRVRVDGSDVTQLPPQGRDLGFVFQNYALFEHLTVADNVEFALRVRKVDSHARRVRRDELLELVGLGGSARKYPAQLSGGQRQRTALARALAHSPRLLLLDEPFGALDARIRQELRQGLRELLKRIGTTAIFVTHDQEEAFAIADRIMVLHRGRLLEEGSPPQLYREPRTEFVASFVGRANLLPGELTRSGARIRLEAGPPDPEVVPRRVKILLRPEKLRLLRANSPTPADRDLFSHPARVDRIEYLGASERVYLSVNTGEAGAGGRRHLLEALRSIEASHLVPLQAGDEVTLFAEHVHAVPQPDLRILAIAPDDPDGHAVTGLALAYGERTHALVTVLGGAVAAPDLHARLEHYRQSFAGDLRLIDSSAHEVDLWRAARAHLDGESCDLVLLPVSMRQPQKLLKFLREAGVQQVLLAAPYGNPLAAAGRSRWSVLLRAFAAGQPDINLLAEMAGEAGANVEMRDLAGGALPSGEPARWSDALTLRSVAFTIEDGAATGPADEVIPIDESADVIALDLGPRSALGARQQAWLRALDGRWAFLMVQPDESDLHLFPTSAFRNRRGDRSRTPFVQETVP